MLHDAEYQKQIQYGRTVALEDESPAERPPVERKPQQKKKAPYRPAEGHEIGLASHIKYRQRVRVRFASADNEDVVGSIVAFDRYTVSVLVDEEEFPRIYYKSHILFFQREGDK